MKLYELHPEDKSLVQDDDDEEKLPKAS
jgi:hypothetical protein